MQHSVDNHLPTASRRRIASALQAIQGKASILELAFLCDGFNATSLLTEDELTSSVFNLARSWADYSLLNPDSDTSQFLRDLELNGSHAGLCFDGDNPFGFSDTAIVCADDWGELDD